MSVGTGYNLSFPTPESLPEDKVCRIFTLPADPIFLGAFMGALEYLTDPDHWQQVGSVSPEDSAQAIFDAIDEAYALAEDGVCSANVPAPYWDDSSADDADDQEPAESQEWYGEVQIVDGALTFQENVQIWIVAGFVMLAATPAAAIAFVPIAQRFTLAARKHDLGGIVKAFIDGSEVGQMDTYSADPGVVKLDIVIPPAAALLDDPHALWVVMSDEVNPAVTGDPQIQLLRKRLTADEVAPPNIRWNEDCDCVQQTPDEGTTWVDTPESDPRHGAGFRLPAVDEPDIRCDAAERMTRAMNRYVDTVIDLASIIEAVNGVLALILIVLPGAGVLIDLFIAGVEALFGIGLTAINLAMTDPVYEQIFCIIYCGIGEDGQMSADQLGLITDKITAQIGGIPEQVWRIYSGAVGENGLSNAGVVGTETGDCSGCGCAWCYKSDGTNILGDWLPEAWAGSPDTLPSYSAGVWQSGYFANGGHNGNYVHIRWVFSGTFVLTDAGAFSPEIPDNRNIWANGDGSLFSGTRIWNNGTWEGGAGFSATSVDVIFWRNIDQGVNPFTLEWAQFSGAEDASENPFGENNC